MNGKKYRVTIYGKVDDVNSNRKIPRVLRAILIGPSNCGKTTLLMNFIYKNWLDFKYLYVFSKSLEQPLYQDLLKRYRRVEQNVNEEICFFYDNSEELVSVDDCNPDSLVVFDDCLLEKQSEIKNFFTRGRHKNISCIYLSQCYNLVDTQVIRNNINFACIFPQSKHYMKNIFDDLVRNDMKFEKFNELCGQCWNDPHGFLTIDLTKKSGNGKYKNQFNDIII